MSCSNWSHGETGFTLLELLIVMTLLALFSVAGSVWAPRYFGRASLDRAASNLERDLSKIAERARESGKDQSVQITGEMRARYAGYDNVSWRWIAAKDAGTTEDAWAVTFFGTGGASGGAIELSSEYGRTVLSVDWLTGHVHRSGDAP